MIVTLAAVVALALAYVTPYVNPNRVWALSYLGLAIPILYVVNLLLMLYWACRWKGMFFLPAIVVLIGIPQIKKYYHIPISKSYAEVQEQGSFRVMTYNVEGFVAYDEETKKSRSTASSIVGFIREMNPDIICLQEFQSTRSFPEATLNEWLAEWPYRRMGYSITVKGTGVFGVALYSKFPIVADEDIRFENSSNGAVSVDVVIGKKDTLRVICAHLETTYVDRSNVEFLNYQNFTADPDKPGKIRQIASRLRKGFRRRAFQADSLASIIAGREIPTVVCGDFNDTPNSYTYHTIREGYGDTFSDQGSGYGFTYKRLYGLLRIDYILRSPELETLHYESPDVEWSDHNPVVVALRLRKP